ncbi:MAG: hypothetical protein OEV59_00685 [Deltaproteobacteria bacterium]|nr:hypothetical protein [Deltaproteobacteria bacterium]
MTRKRQKEEEVFYAQAAGKLLCANWDITEPLNEKEWPDLVVKSDKGEFGLEVRHIFSDESDSGSIKKQSESKSRGVVEELANAYYRSEDKLAVPIKAQFLGDIDNEEELLSCIVENVKGMAELEQKRCEPYKGCVVYIRRLPDMWKKEREWVYVPDKVGWVRTVDRVSVESIIREKAENLPKYKMHMKDVRLLLVADRMFDSGKIYFPSDFSCDIGGFKVVYCFSYPENIKAIISSSAVEKL